MEDFEITIKIHGIANRHFQHRRFLPTSFINQAALNVLGITEPSCYLDENDGSRKIDIEVMVCGILTMLTFRVLTSFGPVQQSEMILPICVIGRDNQDNINSSATLALTLCDPVRAIESDLQQS